MKKEVPEKTCTNYAKKPMFSSEKEIVAYYENLVFRVDTIHETRKLNYKNYNDEETDNTDRNTIISKIKEIELFNLERFKSNSKSYQYCYLAKCSITGKIRKTAVALLITNFFLEDFIIQGIKRNGRKINLGYKYQFLANLLDLNTNISKGIRNEKFITYNMHKIESFKLRSKFYENDKYKLCHLLGFEPLKNITRLQILHFIPTINKNMFHYLFNLEDLILSGCFIKKLENGAFNGLFNLKQLDLSKNHIEDIDNLAFKDLKNLCSLKFDIYAVLDKYGEINYLNTNKKYDFDFGIEKLEEIFGEKEKMLTVNEFAKLSSITGADLGKILPKFVNLRFLNAPYVTGFENFNFEYLEFLILEQTGKVPTFCSSFQRLKAFKIQDVTDFEIDCFKNLSSLDYLDIRAANSTILDKITTNVFNGLIGSDKKIRYFCMGIDIVDDQMIDFNSKMDLFNSLFHLSENKIERQFSSFSPKRSTFIEIFDFIDTRVIIANFRLMKEITYEYNNYPDFIKHENIIKKIRTALNQIYDLEKPKIFIDENFTFYSEIVFDHLDAEIQSFLNLILNKISQTLEGEIKEFLQMIRKNFIGIKNLTNLIKYSLEKANTIYSKYDYKLEEILILLNKRIHLAGCDYFLLDLYQYLTQIIDLIDDLTQKGIIFEFNCESNNKFECRELYRKYFSFKEHFIHLIDRSLNEIEFEIKNKLVLFAIRKDYFSQLLDLIEKSNQIMEFMVDSIDPLRMLPSSITFGQKIHSKNFIKKFKRNLSILYDSTQRIEIWKMFEWFKNEPICAFKMRKNLICEPVEYFSKDFFGSKWDSLFGKFVFLYRKIGVLLKY
ncbi:hypothetical protein BpHYR1_017789 [Brachionus plicatilis]|uniref:Uncharacterized protein n=1 Tax=Brachionus plicatilis TaxID=10195 RepID=A0A3M7QV86_BRAPC|nr:hypothetical protein BpHYR1_017789 [Brachionus plicatilis]